MTRFEAFSLGMALLSLAIFQMAGGRVVQFIERAAIASLALGAFLLFALLAIIAAMAGL
ncbi:MAG TPA: hypothetical protein VL996_14285 [Methylocella sp.]|nr:hypothetical protein [Methylocella sp.]